MNAAYQTKILGIKIHKFYSVDENPFYHNENGK